MGHYPERVFADKIYRTCENCIKQNRIRLFRLALGSPKKDVEIEKRRIILELYRRM